MEVDAEPAAAMAEQAELYINQLAAALTAIEALPLVNSVALDGDSSCRSANAVRVRANLKTRFLTAEQEQRPKVCCSGVVPTQLAAAQKLLTILTGAEYKEALEQAFSHDLKLKEQPLARSTHVEEILPPLR